MEAHPETLRKLAAPHRAAVLRSLLWITIVSGLGFAILNLQKGTYPLAIVELAMVAYSAYMLRAIRHTRHLERWILAYLIPFFCAMMFAMTTPRATASVFSWVLLIPIISHLLLGRRMGLIFSLFFSACAAFIFFYKHASNPALMEPIAVGNVVVLTLCILIFSHVYELSRERTELQLIRMAQTDNLTGLANRLRFKEFFAREALRAQRTREPVALLVIDLDHFKEVNDNHGHETGDSALVFVASLISSRLRGTDLAARLGGEEFGVILPDTHRHQAAQVAEDLRQTLENTPFTTLDQKIRLTMSIGVAEYGRDGSSLQALLSAADRRLYQSKDQGRNRVISSETEATREVEAARCG